MMLEEVIRYAIDGMSIDDNLTTKDFTLKIQDLIDVLIDYPDYTDKDLKSILSGRWNPYQSKS